MTDSYITGEEPTKKLQTYENNIGGEDVHSEAVTPTDENGIPFGQSNPFYTSGTIAEASVSAKSVLANTTGDTTVHTPSSGKKVRLYWYNMAARPDNPGHVLASLKFGTNPAFNNTPLSQYGAATAHGFKAGRSYIEGAVDEALIITLDSAVSVYCNIDYEEAL